MIVQQRIGAVIGLVVVLAGCGPSDPPSSFGATSPVPSSSVGSPSGGPSSTLPGGASPSGTVIVPDRITWFRAGAVLATPPDGRMLTPRTFDTGIQAVEPTMGLLPDGSFAVQGWDRPVADEQGTAHVFVGSPTGGDWREITAPPAQVTHDPYLAVDPRSGRIFSANLRLPGELDPKLFCVTVAFTADLGGTWTPAEPICETDADRPRVITTVPVTSKPTDGPSIVHVCYYHSRINGQSCLRSLDGGRTFGPSGDIPADDCDPGPAGPLFGHLATDPTGVLYLARVACGIPVIAISRDEGLTWQEHQIGPKGWNGFGEMGVAVDADGTVYGVWVGADRLPYLAASRDDGTTWSKPLLVSPPGVREVNLPTLDAGAAGHLAIGMIVSTDAPMGSKPSVPAQCSLGPCPDPVFYEAVTWHAALTVTANALAAEPILGTTILNDPTEPIVRGGCGPGRCKANGDFLDGLIDEAGVPWLAFVTCPDGICPTNARKTWASSIGTIGSVEGLPLR